MNVIAPNIARPITKPNEDATLKMAERNRFSGMIGSFARASCAMKSPTSTMLATPRPMIVADPHGYSLPPQVVSRMIALTPAVSSVAPR
jgi:hypothetical protein